MLELGLKVLLVESDPDTADHVRNLLSQAEGLSFDVERTETLLLGLDRLAKGDVDVVLIGSGLPDCHGLDAVPAVRMHAPSVPIVIVGDLDSAGLALRAVEIGAQDYLVKGRLDTESLSRSLRCAVLRQKSQAESAVSETRAFPARIIGCVGAKGGVGTTTVACQVALGLKRQTGHRVLVADINPSGGSVAFLTRTKITYSTLDAVSDVLRLDQSFWERVVSTGPEELEVLPLAAPIDSDDLLRPERIRHVLRFLRSIYPWIVLDLGRLTPLCAGLLSELSDLLLITSFDLAAMSETRRAVDRLAELAFASRRVTLIVNKVDKQDCSSAREVPKILGIPGSVIVPAGSAELLEAHGPMRSQMMRLAADMAGIERPAARGIFPLLPWFSTKSRQLKIA